MVFWCMTVNIVRGKKKLRSINIKYKTKRMHIFPPTNPKNRSHVIGYTFIIKRGLYEMTIHSKKSKFVQLTILATTSSLNHSIT